jgi:glycosyltransferase involved in cell wall biosynthesis
MNILYITQFFSATRGGGEIIFYDFAEGMAKRGHHVDIVSHQITNFKEEDNLDGVAIHRIRPAIEHKGGLPPSIKQNLMYIINAIIKGSQIIRQNKIDIIHTNNFSPVIVGSILAKIYNIPIVITIHDIFTTRSGDYWKKWAAQNNVSRISSIIGPLFEKITVKMPVDIVHTVSNASKQDILNFKARSSSSNIIVIPNGINLRNYGNLEFKKDYQNYVLFIGRLVFLKNLDVLISSFKDVVKKIPNARLIVVGDGPMRDNWQKMVSELHLDQNIEFTGYIPHEKKYYELLSKCSSLLLPSVFEGFGLVLLEAFAMSKPVLVANMKPFDEIVDEGIDGFILPTHDAHKWSEKIIFLLSNKTICQDMGCKGRLKVESKFNIDNVVDKVESLYTELCFKKRSNLKGK